MQVFSVQYGVGTSGACTCIRKVHVGSYTLSPYRDIPVHSMYYVMHYLIIAEWLSPHSRCQVFAFQLETLNYQDVMFLDAHASRLHRGLE